MGKVLSSFTNGWAGTIARAKDDVVIALPNKSGNPMAFGIAVAMSEDKTGVVPFNGETHTGADFVGVTVRAPVKSVRAPVKSPDTYGSAEGKYEANDMVDILVRGHIVAKVITGTTTLGGQVSIRKSDNAFAIGTGDTFVALPNVRVSAVADGLKNTELLLTERNIL